MSDIFDARLDDLERRLAEFASELTRLRHAAAAESYPAVAELDARATETSSDVSPSVPAPVVTSAPPPRVRPL